MTATKENILRFRRVSNRKMMAVILSIIIISTVIACYSSNLVLIVNDREHCNPYRLEDMSSRLQGEIDNSINTYSVLEALTQDGYNPVALSAICLRSGVVRIIPLNNTIQSKTSVPCSNTSLVSPDADLIVPNVVHYVFTGPNKTFNFIAHLSFLSVERFIKPEQIFVHGDQPPSGYWWDATVHHVRNIYFVKRPYVDIAPNGMTYAYPAHSSDYLRAETLVRYGGIYLDSDVIVLKSFDPLRSYSMVLGRETGAGICNGIIIAQKGAIFLRLMLEQYRSYEGLDEEWSVKSVLNVNILARLYPHLVHVEETSLHQPNWLDKELIYDGLYNWTENYAMHMWVRMWPREKRPSGPEDVQNKIPHSERYLA